MNQGFTVVTQDKFVNAGGGVSPGIRRPFVPVSGDYVSDSAPGSVRHYSTATGSIGQAFISNAIAPAHWNHFVTFSVPCGTNELVASDGFSFWTYEDPNVFTPNLAELEWDCLHFEVPPASTRLVVQDSTPSTLNLGTDRTPFSTTYGMPVLYLYNPDSSIAASATASSVASDGSSATFSFPTLPSGAQLPSNLYGVTLLNRNSSSGYSNVTFNILSVASHETLDAPFGVGAGWSNSSYSYSYTSDPYNDGTCAGNTTTTSGSSSSQFPVVSLYSDNVVLAGTTRISVGAGPTTLVVYGEQTTDDFEDSGCQYSSGEYVSDTTSDQMTRAIVANSGGNSVSVLDIVNDVAIATISVGHTPTGIALSPDQSKAYVANYGDGTVSEIDLNAMSVIGTG